MDKNSINARHFPHLDLSETSSRPGVDGPRYVPAANGLVGDTNTGRHVHPREPDVVVEQMHIDELPYRNVPLIR